MIRLLKDCSKDKNMQLVHYLRNCVASKKNSFEKAREYPTWSVWQHVFVLIRQNRFLCTLTEVKCNHAEHTSHKNWYHSSPNCGEFSRWRESATFFTYKIVYFRCSISLNIVTKKNYIHQRKYHLYCILNLTKKSHCRRLWFLMSFPPPLLT